MTNKLTQGSVIPEFRYDTPYEAQKSFYELLEGSKPVMLVFLRNFGHPLSRHYIMEYAQTIDQLQDARLVCVVQTRPQVIAEAVQEESLPYPLICDAEGVLYEYFGVEREANWLRSYSFKALKIINRAKKCGFEENRKEPQQLPLTAVVAQRGEVLFAHYGQSLTDMPENCGAMQRVMEGLLAALPPREEDLDLVMEPHKNHTVPDAIPAQEKLFRHSFAHERQEQADEEAAGARLEDMDPQFLRDAAPIEPARQTDEEPAEEPAFEEDWGQSLFAEEEADEMFAEYQMPAEPVQPEAPAAPAALEEKKQVDLAKLGFLDR